MVGKRQKLLSDARREKEDPMLDVQTYKVVIENTPLVSLDLCMISNDRILLGKRCNEPLRGIWFTPGGRILKNETWQAALLRIMETEIGLVGIPPEDFTLMGIWDHFYNNSAVDQEISTHYVNLPHYAWFESEPGITLDDQHGEFKWFELSVVSNDEVFQPYMRDYANWLLKNMNNKHD